MVRQDVGCPCWQSGVLVKTQLRLDHLVLDLTLLIQELKAVDLLEGFYASPLPHNVLIAISKEADVVIPHPVPLAHLIIREALSSSCFQKLSEFPPALGPTSPLS